MKNFEVEVKGCKYTIKERYILNLAKYGVWHLYSQELAKCVEDKTRSKDYLSFSCEFHREIYKHIMKMLREEC